MLPEPKRMKATTKNGHNKVPRNAPEMLRLDRGALTRIAKRTGFSLSYVSRVVAGKRRSERVRAAIVRECHRLSRLYLASSVLMDLEER